MNSAFVQEFRKLVEVYGLDQVNAAVHKLLFPPEKQTRAKGQKR